jgi:hypothetical protein
VNSVNLISITLPAGVQRPVIVWVPSFPVHLTELATPIKSHHITSQGRWEIR